LGTNKRYAEQIDARMSARASEAASRPPAPTLVVRDWVPPWPPIRIGESEWVIMRDAKNQPAAIVRTVTLGPRRETFFRVVTWAPRSEERKLVGYFESLAIADRAVLFTPRTPTSPDPRTSTGH